MGVEGLPNVKIGKYLLPAIAGLIVILLISSSTIINVPTGQVAVFVDPFEGSVTTGPVGPAFKVLAKAPWVDVVEVPISTQSILMTGPGEGVKSEPIEVLSLDGLLISIDLNIRYVILAGKAEALFRRYPALNYEIQVTQIVREAIRNIVSEVKAIDVIAKRADLEDPIRETVAKKITSDESLVGAINIIAIEVLRIQPPPQFLQSIENKLQAEQDAIAAEFRRTEKLVQADAERQAAIMKAEGLAASRIIEANATRTAISTVVESLGADSETSGLTYLQLLMYKEIAATGSNVLFIVGQDSEGQMILIPANTETG